MGAAAEPEPQETSRVLTVDDAEEYWHHRLEPLRTNPSFGVSPGEHREATAAEMAARLTPEPPHSLLLGLFDGGRLVGTARFPRDPL